MDHRRWGLLAVLPALTALFLFSLKASHQTADSLDYALSVRTGLGTHHPHHLLFVPLVRVVRAGMLAAGMTPDPVAAGQIHNIFWAALTVLCMFLLAEHLLSSTVGGIVAALCLLLARGFWLYSTQMEAYVPALGCLALLAATLMHRQREHEAPVWMGVLVSVLVSLGVLYHQSNILICIPLAFWLSGNHRGPHARTLWIISLAGVLVFSAYVLAFLHSEAAGNAPDPMVTGFEPAIARFVRFCLAYAFLPNPGWGTVKNFSVMGVGRLIHSQIRDIVTFPWSLRLLVIPGFAAVLAGLVLWHAYRFWRGAELAAERRFLLAWLLSFYAFFLWWFPGEKEFFIVTLFPLILLAALAVRDIWMSRAGDRRGLRTALYVLCCALPVVIGLVNAFGTIVPYHRDRGPAFAAASTLAAKLPAGCLVIGDITVLQNLRYYFERDRVMETAMPLFYFYQGLPLPKRYRLDEEECIAADLSFARPDYSLGGMDGYNHPAGWSDFAEWLLGAAPDFPRSVSACRPFEGLGDVDGSPYVRLAPLAVPVPGIGPVFARLDHEVTRGSGEAGPFQAWLTSRGLSPGRFSDPTGSNPPRAPH